MKKAITTLFQSRIFNIILVGLIIGTIFLLSLQKIGLQLDFSFLITYKDRIISGLITTIIIAFFSFIFSLILGSGIFTLSLSKILFLSYFARAYIAFIRGTPLIMQIYLFYYVIGTAWGIENRLVAGIIILSIFESAYIAEIIRGSFQSIEKQQLESATAIGLDHIETVFYIIVPQLISRTLPALTGQLASIIKDSSLLSLISVIEISQTFREISSSNFRLFESYISLGLLYLMLTLPINFLGRQIEKKFNYAN